MKNLPFVIAIPLIVVLVIGASVFAWKMATTSKAPSQTTSGTYQAPSINDDVTAPSESFTNATPAKDTDVAGMQKDLESVQDDGGADDLKSLEQEATSL